MGLPRRPDASPGAELLRDPVGGSECFGDHRWRARALAPPPRNWPHPRLGPVFGLRSDRGPAERVGAGVHRGGLIAFTVQAVRVRGDDVIGFSNRPSSSVRARAWSQCQLIFAVGPFCGDGIRAPEECSGSRFGVFFCCRDGAAGSGERAGRAIVPRLLSRRGDRRRLGRYVATLFQGRAWTPSPSGLSQEVAVARPLGKRGAAVIVATDSKK